MADMEIRFSLDGVEQVIVTDPKRSALHVLREDLGVTTLKSGCSPQGICGCCLALVNDRPRITCTLPAKALAGKTVITHASLDPEEARAYAEAFVRTGGTQCGYCTPGMVLQTKALLDRNPDPDDEAISKAMQTHLCRCTGWKKIHDAVHAAAAVRRGQPPPFEAGWHPPELFDAVLGQRPTIDDMVRPGLLHAALVWTPVAHGKVTKIDASAAAALPGVRAVATAAELPLDCRVGRVVRDRPVLVAEGETTACCADVLAVVAAETSAQARAAAEAVVVEVAALPPLLDPEASDDVLATARQTRGGVPIDEVLAGCAHVVRETFETAWVEPAPLEPEAALAVPLENGVRVWSGGQDVWSDRRQLAALFGLDEGAIEVIGLETGGAFGAKLDLGVQPYAVLMARLSGRPVKLSLSMEEATRFHAKRHPFRMTYEVGADAEGRIQAVRARILADTGGYASAGPWVVNHAARHAAGPYAVPHVDVEAKAVRTNNPIAGAIRGAGVPQVTFAIEGCIDRLADALGRDPLELRLANLPEGPVSAALEALRPRWEAVRVRAGVACATAHAGGRHPAGRATLDVVSDHEVVIHAGISEVGQGHVAAMSRLAAEVTGLAPDTFTVAFDTRRAIGEPPEPSGTTALASAAVRQAAEELCNALGDGLGALVGRRFEAEWHHDGELPGGAIAQLAVLDAAGRVEELVAAVHVGRVVNRIDCEGQVEGGMHMGLGMALSEELAVDDRGMPDLRFRELGIVKDRYMPRLTAILLDSTEAPRGVGELGVLAVAPAIAAAIHARDGIWHSRLPMKQTAAAAGVGVRLPRTRR